MAQNTVNSFFFLQNSFDLIRQLDLQLGQLAGDLSQSLKKEFLQSSAKLITVVNQQEEELSKIKFNLAITLPNLEGLLQNEVLKLWEHSLPFKEIINRLLSNARSVVYDCYKIELREVIKVDLKEEKFTIFNPFNLSIAIYILIDEVIKNGKIIQNKNKIVINIYDEIRDGIYNIFIDTDCLANYSDTALLIAVQERLNPYQGLVSGKLIQNRYCWKIQLPC